MQISKHDACRTKDSLGCESAERLPCPVQFVAQGAQSPSRGNSNVAVRLAFDTPLSLSEVLRPRLGPVCARATRPASIHGGDARR